MFKQIWYFLTFKIYQGNLLTAGGANYLTVISVIVFLAALSEGFAWVILAVPLHLTILIWGVWYLGRLSLCCFGFLTAPW